MEVIGDESFADKIDIFELVAAFRHHLLDLLRMLHVDGNDAAARRAQIGLEPKERPLVFDELVVSVLFVQELDNFRLRVPQVFIEDPVLRVGSLRDRDDEIRSILGDFAIEQPVLVICALVNQRVCALWRA